MPSLERERVKARDGLGRQGSPVGLAELVHLDRSTAGVGLRALRGGGKWAQRRLLDTLVGFAVALVATYLLWPRNDESDEPVPVTT